MSVGHMGSGNDNDHNRRVVEMCAKTRKIVGFTPIEPRMLELQVQSLTLSGSSHQPKKTGMFCMWSLEVSSRWTSFSATPSLWSRKTTGL